MDFTRHFKCSCRRDRKHRFETQTAKFFRIGTTHFKGMKYIKGHIFLNSYLNKLLVFVINHTDAMCTYNVHVIR